LRLRDLAYPGEEQPNAHPPEHEPLADERRQVGAAAPERFDDHGARRQHEQQQNNGRNVHCGFSRSAFGR
jgi:hypothetical protein